MTPVKDAISSYVHGGTRYTLAARGLTNVKNEVKHRNKLKVSLLHFWKTYDRA